MGKTIRNRHNKNGVNIKICGKSNKGDKEIANRKFRRKETKESRDTFLQEEDMFKTNDIKDVSNIYDFASDGRPIYVDFKRYSDLFDDEYRLRNK